MTNNGEVKSQLYISYGEKSDAELLLNYGFLESTWCISSFSFFDGGGCNSVVIYCLFVILGVFGKSLDGAPLSLRVADCCF